MILAKIRLMLAFLFVFIGFALHYKFGLGSAWYLYLSATILAFTHFKFGVVSAAFLHLSKGKLDDAEFLIDSIKRPDWLTKRNQAYYHFTKGMVALQRKEFPPAEIDLKMALDKGLRNDNDKALVSLNLAHLYFVQKKKKEALNYLNQAKAYDSDDLMIAEKIKEMASLL